MVNKWNLQMNLSAYSLSGKINVDFSRTRYIQTYKESDTYLTSN